MSKSFLAVVAVTVMLLGGIQTQAATVTVSDDTFVSHNGTPGFPNTADAEDNFGGRTELIIGPNNNNPRDGIVRFDVSSLAAQINGGTPLASATLTLYERTGRNDIQPADPTTFSVSAIVDANADWVEGTKQGSAAGWSGETGSVSLLYLSTPSDVGQTDGTQWFSAGGGATPLDDIPASGFTVGTDTGASLGTGVITSDAGNAEQTWTISLDAAAIQALLPNWLADPTGNAGLAITYESGGGGQWFFGSVESGADVDPATSLDLQFIPEPASLMLVMLAGLGLTAVRLRYRLG